jgi:hypothetical protein
MQKHDGEEYFEGFSWALPRAFAAPLAACRFELGDILYDTAKAYQGEWHTAQKHIRYSIEVKAPMRGGSTKSDEDQESAFADNWNSRVEFTLRDHQSDTDRHVVTTQGRLYYLLWRGTVDEFETADVSVPAPARELMEHLKSATDHLHTQIPKASRKGGLYLTPFDTAEQRLWTKTRTINEALKDFGVTRGVVDLKEVGIKSASVFMPTACIAWFAIGKATSFAEFEAALKRLLHKPAKNKKTNKEVFSAGRHGHYVAAD